MRSYCSFFDLSQKSVATTTMSFNYIQPSERHLAQLGIQLAWKSRAVQIKRYFLFILTIYCRCRTARVISDCEVNRGVRDEERDLEKERGEEGRRRVRFGREPPWYSPEGGRKTTENIPKVAGYERGSNPDLPNKKCAGWPPYSTPLDVLEIIYMCIGYSIKVRKRKLNYFSTLWSTFRLKATVVAERCNNIYIMN